MNSRSRLRTGVAALAAAAAVLGSLTLLPGSATAAPGDAPAGPMTLNPATGTSSSVFALGIPLGAACPGDNPAGWQWSAFVAPSSADIGGLRFSASGLVQAPVGEPAALYRSLRTGGVNVTAQNPGLVDGLINPSTLNNLNLSGAALTAGTYTLAVACYNDGSAAGSTPLQVGRFFSAPITVTAQAGAGVNNYTYAFGAVPAAPVLTTTSVTATSVTVNFTHAASVPATTGYTATVTSAPAGPALAPIAIPAGATSFAVTGLTTGTAYSVTLVATNAAGTSPVSNTVTVTFSPFATPQPSIVPTLTRGVGEVTIGIPAVTIGGSRTALPTSYTLAVSPAPAAPGAASYTIPFAAGPLTQVVPGITARTPYTFTLTVNYPAPNNGPGGVVTSTEGPLELVFQRITVTRPVGQLILTQRCGVNGAMPALPADAGFPGFPSALPAVVASTSQVGTSPDITPNGTFGTGAGLFADAVTPDPQFNNYPFPSPATYPTECGVNLGTATIVNSGPLAGQYYEANGFINEVTVSDARDTDLGWEVRGQMSNFVGTVSNTNIIDGDYLGWTPYVQNTTPTTGTGYTQTVAPGAQVLPGTGVVSGSGLGSGRRLSIATENLGLGIAQMDARLRMLIPITANNDVYTGILNFTVLDNDNGPI